MRQFGHFLIVLACPSVLFSGEYYPTEWQQALNSAARCTEEVFPDLNEALACHEELITICLGDDAFMQDVCLENAVKNFSDMADELSAHADFDRIAKQYDPQKCKDEKTEMLCLFVAYGNQAVFGHIAHVWGELPE